MQFLKSPSDLQKTSVRLELFDTEKDKLPPVK